MKRHLTFALSDGSTLTAWYDEQGHIVELYHELPMAPDRPGGAPVASILTCIDAMIPAINAGGIFAGLRGELYAKIFEAGW